VFLFLLVYRSILNKSVLVLWVALLRSRKDPVICNIGVGSNKEVAELFNRMTIGLAFDQTENLKHARAQILRYYNNTKWRTFHEFRSTYLGKPWLVVSLLAAFALLVMTLLQTIFTILSYEATV
jgi:hypothetical protein